MLAKHSFKIIFVSLLIFASLPIWIFNHLPILEYPYQLLISQIVQKISDPLYDYSRHFVVFNSFDKSTPYFVFANLLKNCFSPIVIVKTFITIYILLLPVSFLVFLRSINKNLKWISLFSFIFLYNYAYYVASFDFLFCLPLFFFALASLEYSLKNTRSTNFCIFILMTLSIYYVQTIIFIILFIVTAITTVHVFSHNNLKQKRIFLPMAFVFLFSILLIILNYKTIFNYAQILLNYNLAKEYALVKWNHPWKTFMLVISSPASATYGIAKILVLILTFSSIFHPIFNRKNLTNNLYSFYSEDYIPQKKYIFAAAALTLAIFLTPKALLFKEYPSLSVNDFSLNFLNLQLIPILFLIFISLLPFKAYNTVISKILICFVCFSTLGITFLLHSLFQQEMIPFAQLLERTKHGKIMVCAGGNKSSEYFEPSLTLNIYICDRYSYEKGGITLPFPNEKLRPVQLSKEIDKNILSAVESGKIDENFFPIIDYFVSNFKDPNDLKNVKREMSKEYFKKQGFTTSIDFGSWTLFSKEELSKP